jgi:hypothetical protein
MATGKRFPDTFANPHKNAIANNCFSPAESRCLGTGLPFKSYKDKGKVLASIAIQCNKYRKVFFTYSSSLFSNLFSFLNVNLYRNTFNLSCTLAA